MNIILTGSTGTLGSRILFSLLEGQLGAIDTIYLPVRKKGSQSAPERTGNMLRSKYFPEFIKKNHSNINKKAVARDFKNQKW